MVATADTDDVDTLGPDAGVGWLTAFLKCSVFGLANYTNGRLFGA